MQISNFILIILVTVITACSSGPQSVYVEDCKNSTPAASSARWNCLTQASEKEQQQKIQQQQIARMESFKSRCDAYGFKRGTTEFAQCLQQAEAQQSMDNSIQMQQFEIDRRSSQENFRKAQCYATGRLDC